MEKPLFDKNHPVGINKTYINQTTPDFIKESLRNAFSLTERNLEYLLNEISNFSSSDRWKEHEKHYEAHRILAPKGDKEHQEISNPDISELDKLYYCYCYSCKIKAAFLGPTQKYMTPQKRERMLTKNKVKHPRIPKGRRKARARKKAPWFKMKQKTYDRLYGWADER